MESDMERVIANIKGRANKICESQHIDDDSSKRTVYSGIVHWEMLRELYPVKMMLNSHVRAHKCAKFNLKNNEIEIDKRCDIVESLHNQICNIKAYWGFVQESYNRF